MVIPAGAADAADAAGTPGPRPVPGSRPAARLLYVVNDAGFFCSHRLPIARAAVRAGIEVHVATPVDGAVDRIREAGLTHHALSLTRRGTGPLTELAAVLELARLYRAVRPDIVHHVTMKPVLYGTIASRLARVPAVVNAVSGLGFLFIARGATAGVRRLVALSLARIGFGRHRLRVIFQNDADAALFRERRLVTPAQTVMIRGSGVDLGAFRPSPEPTGAPLVLLAGRMLWDKGVAEFVEAARLVRRSHPQARFALVGDSDAGNPAAVPLERLRAWQQEGTVEWWGPRTDMPAVLAAAHVVCLPSYREGMPKVLLEAAACGRAVVATDVPGCRDAVRPGVTGVLVPPRDAAALAGAVARLLDDPAERERMGAAGRQLAEREFDEREVVRRTLALYAELGPACR